MGIHRWRAASLAAALLAAACRDVAAPAPRTAGFALLSTAPRPLPGQMLSGAAADSSIEQHAIAHDARGVHAPLLAWKSWKAASTARPLAKPPLPRSPSLIMMPDGYEGDDQRNAFWIWGPQTTATLPAMAGDVEVIPGSITGKAQYDGDNASIALGYELTPINAGVGTQAPKETTDGPGTRLCWYYFYCHQWEITAERNFSGIGGCGMNLTGSATYKAWRARYEIYAVDYTGGITIGTTGGNYTTGYKYVFMPRTWGQASLDQDARDTGSPCDTEQCSVATGGGGETGGGVTGDATRIVAAPRFDCTFAVGIGQAWTTKICITWETGYVDLYTGKRVVLATWVDCYVLDENGGWYRIDRSGQPLTLDGDVPPLAPPPTGAAAPGERRITLVGVTTLPGESPTRVVRRKHGPLADAVLVDLARARPEDIESAIHGLRVMLAVQRDSGAAATDGSIAFSDLGRGWAGARQRQAADRLAALAAAPVREIPGLGRVHAMEAYVTVPSVRRVSGSARR